MVGYRVEVRRKATVYTSKLFTTMVLVTYYSAVGETCPFLLLTELKDQETTARQPLRTKTSLRHIRLLSLGRLRRKKFVICIATWKSSTTLHGMKIRDFAPQPSKWMSIFRGKRKKLKTWPALCNNRSTFCKGEALQLRKKQIIWNLS